MRLGVNLENVIPAVLHHLCCMACICFRMHSDGIHREELHPVSSKQFLARKMVGMHEGLDDRLESTVGPLREDFLSKTTAIPNFSTSIGCNFTLNCDARVLLLS